jgi:hypothetical protein
MDNSIDGNRLYSSNEDISKLLAEQKVIFIPPPVLDTFGLQCYFAYQLVHHDLPKVILGARAKAIQICAMHPASGYCVADVYNYTENKDVNFEDFKQGMIKKLKQRVEENSNAH